MQSRRFFCRCVIALTCALAVPHPLPRAVAENDIAPPGMFPTQPLNRAFTSFPLKGQLLFKLSPDHVARLRQNLTHKGRPPREATLLRKIASLIGLSSIDRLNGEYVLGRYGRRLNMKKVHQSQASGLIMYVENNFKVHAFGGTNDFFYQLGFTWGLNNSGAFLSKADVDVDAPEAWEITTGSPDTVTVIIDTGILYTHPDLAGSMWKNPGEIPGNRKDDDGNGFVDDVYGYDFVNNDGDPLDDMFHGTHVAGIVGATGNNGSGIAGVAYGSRLMALKILDKSGEGDVSNAVRAIDYAVMMKQRGVNIRVMNASFGGGDDTAALREALQRANGAGILFVAAAGNSTADNDAAPVYPASYRMPNVLSVLAVDSFGGLASFSNYGATTVDVGAPGDNILSTVTFNFYFPLSGTSMASPFVAGIAALVASAHPELSPAEIRSRIIATAKPDSALTGKCLGGGIASAFSAITGQRGPAVN